MGLHQCQVEGRNHLPQPAGNTLPNAAQEPADCLCHKAHWCHVQCVHQDLLGPFLSLCFPISHQHILVHRISPFQSQDPVFPFVKLNEIHGPSEVCLNCTTNLWHISHSSQLCIIHTSSKSTFCPIIFVINEGTKQYGTQCMPLGYIISVWLPAQFCAIDQNFFSLASQSAFKRPYCPLYLACTSSTFLGGCFVRQHQKPHQCQGK